MPYLSGGYEALGVTIGDLDGDGKPDLVVANACATISNCNNSNSTGGLGVLLGNGDGTFQTAVIYGSGGNIASAVAVGDLNGDGKSDVIATNECGNAPNCTGARLRLPRQADTSPGTRKDSPVTDLGLF